MVLAVAIIFAVVTIEEAVFRIPVSYAKRAQTTYLPIKVNVAGVMPIIFAVSLVSLPSLLGQALSRVGNQAIATFARNFSSAFSGTSVLYLVTYFVMVIAFTFSILLLFLNQKMSLKSFANQAVLFLEFVPVLPLKKD